MFEDGTVLLSPPLGIPPRGAVRMESIDTRDAWIVSVDDFGRRQWRSEHGPRE